MATTLSPAPMAKRISVALESRETMRNHTSLDEEEGIEQKEAKVAKQEWGSCRLLCFVRLFARGFGFRLRVGRFGIGGVFPGRLSLVGVLRLRRGCFAALKNLDLVADLLAFVVLVEEGPKRE